MADRLSSDNEEQELNQSATESPGAILAAARIKAGLSQESLADELNLSVAKLRALEADQYEKLASDVFAQGYLRRYSKLVGVDDDKLVERFRQWRAENQPEKIEPAPQRRLTPSAPRSGGLMIIVILGLVLLGVAFFFLRNTGSKVATAVPEQGSGQQQVLERELDAPPEEQIIEPTISEDDLPDEVSAVEPVLPEPTVTELSSALAETPESVEARPAAPSLPAQQAAASSGDEAGSAQLSFAFSEECWVEVEDASGRILHAEVAVAGQSFALEGEAPFSVMLGNARAANVLYDGEPVTITTPPGTRTARITVGP